MTHTQSFTAPEGFAVAVEFDCSTRSDAYLLAFYPDHEDWPERMDTDDPRIPPSWLTKGEDAMQYYMTGGR